MEWDFYLSKIEEIIKSVILGFFVFIISIILAITFIVYISVMLSFNNVFLSLFMFALLGSFYYIGKQVRTKINEIDFNLLNDSEPQ